MQITKLSAAHLPKCAALAPNFDVDDAALQRAGVNASVVAVADDDPEQILGFLLAGSLGVRGVVHAPQLAPGVNGCTAETLRDAALNELRGMGVGRCHHLHPEPDSAHASFWHEARFAPQAGELLLELDLTRAPAEHVVLPAGYTLRPMRVEDAQEVIDLMSGDPVLAVAGWESEKLFQSMVTAHPGVCQVVEYEGRLVSAFVGGYFGHRATNTHTFVAKEHRRSELGRAMTEAAADVLRRAGVTVLHLMLTSNNTSPQKAFGFWMHLGFEVVDRDPSFLEADLI